MRLVLLVVVLAVLVLVPFMLFGPAIEGALDGRMAIEWLRGQAFPPWLAGLGLLGADMFLPVPASAVMAALGLLYGPWIGGAVSAIGSFVSGTLGYAACRMFDERAALFLLGEEDLRRGRQLFARFGGIMVAGSRAWPLLPEIMSCVAGLLAMPASRFFTALGCGSLVMGFAMAGLGYLGADAPIATLIVATLLPVGLWLLVGRWIRFR